MEWNWKRVISALIAFILLLLLLPHQARAASSGEIRRQIDSLKQQRADLKSQITEIQKQFDENRQGVLEIVGRKNQLDQELDNLYRQQYNIQEQIAAYRTLIADSQTELEKAQNRYNALNTAYKDRIRTMEENGSLSYWEVLFQANSFSNFLDRLTMIEEIAASDRRHLAELRQTSKEITDAQDTLTAEESELEQTQQDLNTVQTALDAKRADADAIILELIEKGEQIQSLQEQLSQEDTSLLEEIAKAEKEYNAAKHQEWLKYMETYTTVPPETTSAPTAPNDDSPKPTGEWLRPCSYKYMSSPFGLRKSPTSGASSYHQGVDLAAPKGTPIYASRAGIVTRAAYSGSAGYFVAINHGDGYSSIYMHMTTYVVSPGNAVSGGQLIGYVGNTGIATGNHLHFGIAYNGQYINPCSLISF